MMYIPYPRLRVSIASTRRPLCGVSTLALILSLLLTTQPQLSLATTLPDPATPALAQDLSSPPIAFVPNVGQSEPQVQFQAQGLGGTLFFTPDQIVLTLPSGADSAEAEGEQVAASMMAPAPKIETQAATAAEPTTVVRLRFVGANANPRVQSIDQLPGIVNYLLGDDPALWHTNVPTYAALCYEQLYSGIDLRYDDAGGHLKGTYLVAAGADPRRIRWRYEGVTNVQVDGSGNLIAALPATDTRPAPTLREQAPIAWQTINGRQVPVDVRYTIAPDQTIGFAIGSYNPALPLVIDPTLDYSTYLGNTGDDAGRSIAVDGTGALYITGDSTSLKFPGNNSSNQGARDTFVTKLGTTGAISYTTYLGGSSTDVGNDIAVDSDGNAYIVGSTSSSNFPKEPAPPAGVILPGGTSDAFVVTLSITGTPTYSSYLGGSRAESGNSIAVDSDKNIYITGQTESDYFLPLTTPGFDKVRDGIADAFVIKLKNDKTIGYGTYLGGTSADASNAIAVDTGGNAYITGYTSSSNYPIRSAVRPTFGGSVDAFVTKLPVDGGLPVYSTFLGGTSGDYGNGITVDAEGNTYVSGYTSSANFPFANGYQRFIKGGYDAFVTMLNVSGSAIEYSTFLGGTGNDYSKAIVVDEQRAAYVVGSTESGDFPTPNAVLSSRNGGADAFVTKLRPSGSALEYSTYLGGTTNDYGEGIAWGCVNGQCTVYVAGITTSRDFPTLNNSLDPSYNGGISDAFIAKLGAVLPGARLFLQPPIKFVGLEQEFSVDIQVDTSGVDTNGKEVDEGDTVDAYLEFVTTTLEVVEIVPNPKKIKDIHINYAEHDNIKGRVDFSATKLITSTDESGFLEPQFTAASVRFRTRKTTTGDAPASITLLPKPPAGARQSQIYREGASQGAKLGDANIRILSGAILNGHIALEKRGLEGSSSWITPLFRSDDGIINKGIMVYDPDNPESVIGYYDATTDRNGDFSVFLKDIPGDTYPIQIKGGDTLSNLREVDLSCQGNIDFGTLRVGDSTGDDMINGADVSFMVPSYQLNNTDPRFLPYGDTNKDGQIDAEDVSALKPNFLKIGEVAEPPVKGPCLQPTVRQRTVAKAADQPSAVAADSSALAPERPMFTLSPSHQTVIRNQPFTLTLTVDLQSQVADTIDAYLNVDQSHITFLKSDGQPIGIDAADLLLNTTGLSACGVTYSKGRIIERSTEEQGNQGQANTSITCFKSPFLPNTFTQTFYLKANPTEVEETIIKLSTLDEEKVRHSDVYYQGTALDAIRTEATITVTDGRVFVPFALGRPEVLTATQR